MTNPEACFEECEECLCATCDGNVQCDACALCNHYRKYPVYSVDECPLVWEEERSHI